jgi:TPR repeat protein
MACCSVFLGLLLAAFVMVRPALPAEIDDATTAVQRGDYTTAEKTFRKLAGQGDTQAQSSLGLMYLAGRGVPQDFTEALKWFRQAADQGDVLAQVAVGGMYLSGQGVAKDYAEGLKWLRQAADKGDVQTELLLGMTYRTDQAVQDYAQAILWFRRAADKGNAQAQGNLGDMYYRGLGVPQDYSEALKWFRKAADQGATQAYVSLGVMYEKGQGVPRDYAQARKLFESGTAQGAPACANCLAWLLATCPDASIRDGQRALSIATRVFQQSPSAANLDTLAAAYAETGDFSNAVRAQEQAIERLKTERSEDRQEAQQIEAQFRAHLQSYRAKQPWHEP